jgi:D-sedoheptulose 7-phosphate isomerase
MNEYLKIIQDSVDTKLAIIANRDLINNIDRAVQIITNSFAAGGKILFCGNGGSAADAQHLAAELSGRFYFDRRALPAEALHCNTSYLTAVANDYGYEFIYSRILDGIGQKGDVLVNISTSGNSENIINAMKVAHDIGMYNIAFTGQGGGIMKEYADLLIDVPSIITPRIQESHILIGHIICEMVERNILKIDL